jgi:hypothetical protein
MFRREKGVVLIVVILIMVIFTIVGFAALCIAEKEINLTRIETDRAKAFYCAEAGLARMGETLRSSTTFNLDAVLTDSNDYGSYSVGLDANHIYAISVGTSGTVTEKIRAKANFLAPPFEKAIHAADNSGGIWAFQLRGNGDPCSSGFNMEKGGKDKINGNIFVNGAVYMYGQSSVNPAPAPNNWGYNGDVGATGSINRVDSGTSISGMQYPNTTGPPPVDLVSMDYANNNTHNVSQIFSESPTNNVLKDVFQKNPSDRSSECTSTSGDDYFFEPSSGFVLGTYKTGETPLNAGDNRIYYVDGDVWVHSSQTYGFEMKGKVTIVATGDIHICDNIEYKDTNSVLGLVALGKYSGGSLISGGNIYFGDPRFGTMYNVSGLMFAANDFLFNTDAVTHNSAEPTTGFTINGCFGAVDQVSIVRDWYTKQSTGGARPAVFKPSDSKWYDAETNTALNSWEITQLRHYQMIINYDDRVRDQATQPPGLPFGGTKIFAGFSNWQEM